MNDDTLLELKEKYKKLNRFQKIDAWVFVAFLIILIPTDIYYNCYDGASRKIAILIIIIYVILGILTVIFLVLEAMMKRISSKILVIDKRIDSKEE